MELRCKCALETISLLLQKKSHESLPTRPAEGLVEGTPESEEVKEMLWKC